MVNSHPLPTVSTIKGADLVMSNLGTLVATGHELSRTERNIAVGTTQLLHENQYGPGPAEMTLGQIPLPEETRGALANAVS